MGGILHSKNGGIQESLRQCPGRGNIEGKEPLYPPCMSWQIGLVFCTIFCKILRTSVLPHETLQTSIFYLQTSRIPPSGSTKYASTFSPWVLWSLLCSHSLFSVIYLASWLAAQPCIPTLTLAVILVQGKASQAARSWPPTHLTNIAAYLCLPVLGT